MTAGRRVPAGLAAMAALLLGVVPAALAASGNVGIHLGYAKAKNAESGNGLVGGHVELKPMTWLGIQGAVDYRLEATHQIDTGTTQGEVDVRSVPMTATARVYLPAFMPVALFGAGGAGWYHIVYDFSEELEAMGAEDDSQTSFGWHVGAGLEVEIAPRVSMYGEGRAIFMDEERQLDEDVFNSVEEFDYSSSYFAGGLNFKF